MYLDAQLQFDDNAEHLSTEASTNVVDLGIARDVGTGEDLYLVVQVTAAFTDAGSDSTMTVAIEKDTVENFASAETAQTIGTFAALSAVGSRLVAKLQPEALDQRYIRVGYAVANGDLSTGSFDAFITKDIDAFTAYESGYEIS